MSFGFSQQRKNLLASTAVIQVPWIKVTIGDYTFGVFDKKTKSKIIDKNGFYVTSEYSVTYPNYIQSMTVTKINGQVNQYSLTIAYPVTANDDPNFFEKVFSSVSSTRKIKFSYGDAAVPSMIYKDEEAIITKVDESFSFANSMSSVITYVVHAVSTSTLGTLGSTCFIPTGLQKPSDIIKRLFKDTTTGLQNTFRAMNSSTLDSFIAGDDKAVKLEAKTNISVMDLINYLVSCMIPRDTPNGQLSKDIYILTIHDDTSYDKFFDTRDSFVKKPGPYFTVTRTSYLAEHSDAYTINIGLNESTLVKGFSISQNENYSIYYDWQGELKQESYKRTLNNDGVWEEVYAPVASSRNDDYMTRPNDITWWTKTTKYPISATITLQGLLRPATLMQYLRLNVIMPGGHKHNSSGLYIVTGQTDTISSQGYTSQLNLTRISGDNSLPSTIKKD